jgi:hypothetical protein
MSNSKHFNMGTSTVAPPGWVTDDVVAFNLEKRVLIEYLVAKFSSTLPLHGGVFQVTVLNTPFDKR